MPFIRIRKHYIHIQYIILGIVEFFLYTLALYSAEVFYNLADPNADVRSITLVQQAVFAMVMSCGTLAMGCYISLIREGYASMIFRSLVSFCLISIITFVILRLSLIHI